MVHEQIHQSWQLESRHYLRRMMRMAGKHGDLKVTEIDDSTPFLKYMGRLRSAVRDMMSHISNSKPTDRFAFAVDSDARKRRKLLINTHIRIRRLLDRLSGVSSRGTGAKLASDREPGTATLHSMKDTFGQVDKPLIGPIITGLPPPQWWALELDNGM